jgi:phosphoglycerol transferase MdoB-like AlkP superfamily enzyme
MLLYSVIPTKSYSKELLGFSYKKPIYALISFVAGLLVLVAIASFLGVSIPVMGSSNVALPTQFMPMGASISVLVSGSFQLPFWLAIVAAALCIAARLYHRRVAKVPKTGPETAASPTETMSTSVSA